MNGTPGLLEKRAGPDQQMREQEEACSPAATCAIGGGPRHSTLSQTARNPPLASQNNPTRMIRSRAWCASPSMRALVERRRACGR